MLGIGLVGNKSVFGHNVGNTLNCLSRLSKHSGNTGDRKPRGGERDHANDFPAGTRQA